MEAIAKAAEKETDQQVLTEMKRALGLPKATSARDVIPADSNAVEKIIIDKVDFSDVTLTEAVVFLRLKARQQGLASFDIVIPKMPNPEPRISLSVTNIPITQAVKYVAAASGLKARTDSHGFVLE